ncbi:hypothetical protein PHMEG_00037222, partial [Phytophthora megakarya]
TGTLCFSADGLIVWAKHNCTGSWNDGDMSLVFRRCLMDRELNPDQRFGVVADSAFPCSDEMTGRILTPCKNDSGVASCFRTRRRPDQRTCSGSFEA